MGYRHSHDDILDGALQLVKQHGLSALTFRRLGSAIGINDRTVVYYFPSKEALIGEVLVAYGVELQELLEVAFGTRPLTRRRLLNRAWPALATGSTDRIFAVYFEAIGLAAAGKAPYVDMVPLLVDAWVDWLTPRVRADPDRRRTEALAVIAQLDGLLLLRRLAGPDAADQAARALGIDVGR